MKNMMRCTFQVDLDYCSRDAWRDQLISAWSRLSGSGLWDVQSRQTHIGDKVGHEIILLRKGETTEPAKGHAKKNKTISRAHNFFRVSLPGSVRHNAGKYILYIYIYCIYCISALLATFRYAFQCSSLYRRSKSYFLLSYFFHKKRVFSVYDFVSW